MKLLNENDRLLDAFFEIEEMSNAIFRIHWESRGGSDRGSRRSRNKEYGPAFEQLLLRMAANNIRINQIYIASRKEIHRPLNERRIQPEGFSYPIVLDRLDVRELRLAIGRALAAYGQEDDVTGGNATKRMSLDLEWVTNPHATCGELEDALLASDGSAEAERQRAVKYAPLGDFLAAQPLQEIALTLSQIEDLVGSLPATATTRQFWANASGYHISRRSQWLENGFNATFDPRASAVRFLPQDDGEKPTSDPEELQLRVERKLEKLRNRQKRTPPPLGNKKPARTLRGQFNYNREPEVVAWVLMNAGSKCECCQQEAPFEKDDGSPFLEVHHVRPLSEGGPDTVDNAIACCPNCHRQLHRGRDRENTRKIMIQRIDRLIDYPMTQVENAPDAVDAV